LEHLASLGLNLSNQKVLELGAGIGDHTTFFLDRGCRVTVIEGREDNVVMLRDVLRSESRWAEGKDYRVIKADLESPAGINLEPHPVVHCYGLLYHVADPLKLLTWVDEKCGEMMLLETCVSYPDDAHVGNVSEKMKWPTQALHGTGSRPSRLDVFSWLADLFEYVYVPRTQPHHEEFPIDWTAALPPTRLTRAVFIASRSNLAHVETLRPELPLVYERW
jgi:hypothetical protein